MKTDELFYELFKTAPESLFKLANIPMTGTYAFESITVKTTEKRMDGFFRAIDTDGPNLFVEVQGYNDRTLYWRFFREICTWYELSRDERPFIAIILFLDERFDPKNNQVLCKPPSGLICCNLIDCLASVGRDAGALTILKPLIFNDKSRLTEASAEWHSDIMNLDIPEEKSRFLIDLLEYAILQRFPQLTLKEVQKMIQLTPLEETVAVQELIAISREEGEERGEAKGELIGSIKMAQRILGLAPSLSDEFRKKSISELREMLAGIEAKLGDG